MVSLSKSMDTQHSIKQIIPNETSKLYINGILGNKLAKEKFDRYANIWYCQVLIFTLFSLLQIMCNSYETIGKHARAGGYTTEEI